VLLRTHAVYCPAHHPPRTRDTHCGLNCWAWVVRRGGLPPPPVANGFPTVVVDRGSHVPQGDWTTLDAAYDTPPPPSDMDNPLTRSPSGGSGTRFSDRWQ
jgi:hypothetical protein